MILEKPYFLENPDWYRFDEDECTYELTEKAPPEAVESYNEFYEALDAEVVIPERSSHEDQSD